MLKIAAIFPGSDSQFVGMYRSLYDDYPIVQKTIEEAEDATGIKLREICFKGPLTALGRPENSHVAVVAFGVAAFRVFVSETGMLPQFCAGHSLGEYTALICSGATRLAETLKVVQIRNEISKEVQKSTGGCMTIVDNIDTKTVDALCKAQSKLGKQVSVSCFNSSTQSAISGSQDDVELTERLIREKGGSVTPLYNSSPFHSSLMGAGIEKLKSALDTLQLGEFRYPVVSNYTAKPYRTTEDLKPYLLNHLTNPVRWQEIVEYLREKNVQTVIDFSARNIFENIIGSDTGMTTTCFGVVEEREKLFQLFHGEDYRGSKTSFASKSIIAAISTPNSNEVSDDYRKGFLENYARLREVGVALDEGRFDDATDVKKEILSLLREIFEAKKVEKREQERWIGQILDETASTYFDAPVRS